RPRRYQRSASTADQSPDLSLYEHLRIPRGSEGFDFQQVPGGHIQRTLNPSAEIEIVSRISGGLPEGLYRPAPFYRRMVWILLRALPCFHADDADRKAA